MTQDNGHMGSWKGRRRYRDDTPSFIRNTRSKDEILGVNRRRESIPVLAIPRSIQIWQRVRWPLLAVVVSAVLLFIGIVTREVIVHRTVEKKIETSSLGEQSAHVQVLLESNRVLQQMYEKYEGRSDVQAAYGWNAVLLTHLFGRDEGFLADAADALSATKKSDTAYAYAAIAGKQLFEDNTEKAQATVEKGLAHYPNEPRLHWVAAWIHLHQDNWDEGVTVLKDMRQQFPDYLLPLFTLINTGIQRGDVHLIAVHTSELLDASTSNLYGALTSLLVQLPQWNKEPLPEDELAKIAASVDNLTRRLDDAPTRLKDIGTFLQGRVALEKNDPRKAKNRFSQLVGNPKWGLNPIAWLGQTVLVLDGPAAALKTIETVTDDNNLQVLDLKARCYLEEYQVDAAAKAISGIADKSQYDTLELEWILAVRQGNVEAALQRLPDVIGHRLSQVGLELYHLLLSAGHLSGIDRLKEAYRGGQTRCADAIDAWHTPRSASAFDLFRSTEDPCAAALGLSIMADNLAPDTLHRLSTLVQRGVTPSLSTQVDIARVVWKTRGHADARSLLDEMAGRKIESPPLLVRLAKMYQDMELHDDAISVLDEVSTPAGAAIVIESWNALGKRNNAADALTQATKDADAATHPSLAYYQLTTQLESGNFVAVVDGVDAILDSAGTMSAELAELKALALNAMGQRGDGDRFLLQLGNTIISDAGLGESWQTRKAYIDLNMRRGGAFIFKATAQILDMMKQQKIDDPDVLYSYGVISMREGNERGAVRYFNEAIDLNPTVVAPFQRLAAMDKLSDEQRALFKRIHPLHALD